MQKKKLDELFQEKFLDFKDAPHTKVWQAIDASLDKKKKKRMIPVWWPLGGIAAALAIALLLFNPFMEKQSTDEIIVGSENDIEKTHDVEQNPTNINSIDNTNTVPEQLVGKTPGEGKTLLKKNQVAPKNEGILSTSAQKETIISKQSKSQNQNALVELGPEKNNSDTQDKAQATPNNTVTLNEPDKMVAGQNPQTEAITSTENTDTDTKDFKQLESPTVLAANEPAEKTLETPEEDKKSIFDEIANMEENITPQEPKNKWSAGPSIAPFISMRSVRAPR